MPNTLGAMANLPDLDFIEGKTTEDIRDELIADYEESMTEQTGTSYKLERADPHRAELIAAAAMYYQVFAYIDRAAKLNTLKYSYGKWLEHLAEFKGVSRIAATAATATLRFTLSAVRTSATSIPQGTRVIQSSAKDLYFSTLEYAEVPAGELTVDVRAQCVQTGEAGNDFEAGTLTVIVDPIPYVESVTNITDADGGAAEEADDALALRAYLAPSRYAPGTEPGYYYRAKEYSTAIGDVVVTSNQAAGKVDVVFLESDGTSPGEELCSTLQEYLRGDTEHIMDDLVTCSAPEEVEYNICFTYWIRTEDKSKAGTIQAAVAEAVENYQTKQRSIGKDVVPDDLIEMVKAAGAKRLNFTDADFEPKYTAVGTTKVAVLAGTATVNYGGLEDG